MIPSDSSLWRKIISPALGSLIPGVQTHVSGAFVQHIPLEDCGDFVWALVCLTRGAPPEILDRYRFEPVKPGDKPEPEAAERLLRGALEEADFYRFPKGSLARLLFRLKLNVDRCASGSPEETAHTEALERIEDVTVFLAEEHDKAIEWLKPRPKLAITTREGHRLQAAQKPPPKRSTAKLSIVR